jgi:hypothetical protein
VDSFAVGEGANELTEVFGKFSHQTVVHDNQQQHEHTQKHKTDLCETQLRYVFTDAKQRHQQ